MDEHYDEPTADTYSVNGQGPIKELSALDNLFGATGTAIIKRTRNGVEDYLELPIQSVDFQDVHSIIGPQPQAPRIATGARDGSAKFAPDETNPAHVDRMQRYNRRFALALTCLGLTIPIKDAQGTVVWSADNMVKDLDKAEKVLRDMGLVYTQIFDITKAINALTVIAEEQAASD